MQRHFQANIQKNIFYHKFLLRGDGFKAQKASSVPHIKYKYLESGDRTFVREFQANADYEI